MKFLTILFLTLPLYAQVILGIDKLTSDQTLRKYLQNKTIAALAHPASLNSKGEHLVDILYKDRSFKLKVLFTPEHGLRKLQDDWIEDGVDSITGIPYYSLYKSDRRSPNAQLLKNIDVIIIDLQDVGMRFYTFNTTMALTLKAAFENNVDVLILDRPNPLGGLAVEGFNLDKSLLGHFISFFEIPTRHSLTIAEMALYYLQTQNFSNSTSKLHLVKMQNWNRNMIWEETQIPWNTPSPALVTPMNAYMYSILGSLESFNLSVGRGIDNHDAFLVYGAPWITLEESHLLSQNLNLISPHIQFTPYYWFVTRGPYKGEKAHGVKVSHLDFKMVNGFKILIEVISKFEILFQERFKATEKNSWTDRYLGNKNIWDWIQEGKDFNEILTLSYQSQKKLKNFKKDFALYP